MLLVPRSSALAPPIYHCCPSSRTDASSACSIARRLSATCGCRRWWLPRVGTEAADQPVLRSAAAMRSRTSVVQPKSRAPSPAPVRSKAPVQVPVHIHPRWPAPRGLRAPAGIERALAGGDARDWIGKPKLLFVEEVLVHESFGLSRIEVLEDERKEAGERQCPSGLLRPACEVPEDARVLVPALGLERVADAFCACRELLRLAARVARDRRELRETAETVRVDRVHHDVLPREDVERGNAGGLTSIGNVGVVEP